MAGESLSFPGFFPALPPIYLNRCPVCHREKVPILTERTEREFRIACPECKFEGKFPSGSRAASTIRRWSAAELRRFRRHAPTPIPEHHSSAELADEEEPMSEGV